MSHYVLRCKKCGTELKEIYCAFCEHCTGALLVTEYKEPFRADCGQGLWKFNWLPVHKAEFPQPSTIVYRSEALAEFLGLNNLFIAFNGYWPDRGGRLLTCTFKELEAAVALQNAKENGINALVIASAGNTARAFAHLSTITNYPVIIVVPKKCLLEMWYLESSTAVPTIAVGDGDYADSIDLARRIASVLEIPFEGGVKNVAKRDGLGAVLMEAVSVIGQLPSHYFQAVGSGTGAIGVWEVAERFIKEGRFGTVLPKLHLSQNLPFAPMVKAWNRKKRALAEEDLRTELINEITTLVLSNRYPAYSVEGGVYDALSATDGIMYGIENKEVYHALELFEKLEGIDIVPASAVAVASLIKAKQAGNVEKDDYILLNITGGGEKKLKEEIGVCNVEHIVVSKNISDKEIEELLCPLLKSVS